MKAKEFDIKKRDPNWRAMQDIRRSGAGGQHKDKKRAAKQGEVKHKSRMAESLDQPYRIKWGLFRKQGVVEGGLQEFAPHSGDGSGARWYNDDELADLLGDEWLQDMDVSGNLGNIEFTKATTGSTDPAVAYLVDLAQSWLDSQGYHVRVLSARDNEDEGNLDWLIDGVFYRDLDRAKLQQAAQDEHDYYANLYAGLLGQLQDTTWHERAKAWSDIRRALNGGRISLDGVKKKIQDIELEIKKKKGVREGGRRVDNSVKVGEDRLQEFRDDDDGKRDGGGGEDPDFHSRGSWKLDTRHYNQAIDFYSLFGPDEYEDRWVKDPRSGRVVAWEGWRRDLPDTDALGRSIPGKLRKMAGFRWDDVEDTMDDDAPGTGWYYSWSPDWGDIFKQDRDPKDGVAEGSLNEFSTGGDDGQDPFDAYPCYDCGSTIFLHHTKSCDLAEPNAMRDLPEHPGTQHWTGEIPKGLHPIPGLQEGMAEGDEPDEQYLDKVISDLHKDALGMRPDREFGREWMSSSYAEKLQIYNNMLKNLHSDMDEATGDEKFDTIMRRIKKGTKKQATADRREREADSRQKARNAFGPSPADRLSIRSNEDVEEASDWGEPREILEDVLQTLEREVEWPLTEVMDPKEVKQLLSPLVRAVNAKLLSMDRDGNQ